MKSQPPADCELLAEVATPDGVTAGPWRADANGHLVRTLSDGRTQRGNGDITTQCQHCTVPVDECNVCAFCPPVPTATISPLTDIPLPPGAESGDDWETWGCDFRVISTPDYPVIGTDIVVYAAALQRADGTIDDGGGDGEAPKIWITGDADQRGLTGEQARVFRAVLDELAKVIDQWVGGAAVMSNFHSIWCDHRESGETHDDILPYCMKQIHGVELIPTLGEKFAPRMWVYATSPAHPDALTSGEHAENDQQYDGIELVTERYDGTDFAEQKFRLTSDAARSLAATLIRAAEIQQGLTR